MSDIYASFFFSEYKVQIKKLTRSKNREVTGFAFSAQWIRDEQQSPLSVAFSPKISL